MASHGETARRRRRVDTVVLCSGCYQPFHGSTPCEPAAPAAPRTLTPKEKGLVTEALRARVGDPDARLLADRIDENGLTLGEVAHA